MERDSSPVSAAPGFAGANLGHARDHNQRATLQAIRLAGPLSRRDLARLTGLTLPSIANITGRLLDAGLIVEETQREGKRGQPARRIAIDPDGCYALGVNIDRDHVSLALIDLAGNVRARVSEDIAYPAPRAVAKLVQRHLPKLFAASGVSRKKVIGAGIAVPDGLGHVEPRSQCPKSYRAWREIDIGAFMSEALSLPVFVENDAAAAAIGELQFGDGAAAGNFFYVFIGVGLGGGVVLDGRCHRGAGGRSGEIGFLPVAAPGGRQRTLADIVSFGALGERLAAKGRPVASAGALRDLDEAGRRVVEAWMSEAASAMAPVLASTAALLDPATIFLGGRLPLPLMEELVAQLRAAAAPYARHLPAFPEIRVAARAEDAAVLGAAVLPVEALLLPGDSLLLAPEVPA